MGHMFVSGGQFLRQHWQLDVPFRQSTCKAREGSWAFRRNARVRARTSNLFKLLIVTLSPSRRRTIRRLRGRRFCGPLASTSLRLGRVMREMDQTSSLSLAAVGHGQGSYGCSFVRSSSRLIKKQLTMVLLVAQNQALATTHERVKL